MAEKGMKVFIRLNREEVSFEAEEIRWLFDDGFLNISAGVGVELPRVASYRIDQVLWLRRDETP